MTDISYQLFSSRNFPLPETLAMLAELGYSQVEGFGALFEDASAIDDLCEMLSANGLTMPTAHFGLDFLEKEPNRAIATAEVLGIQAVFGPFLMPEDRPTDVEGWRDFGKRLAAAAEPMWDAGLTFGWHNHDFEFEEIDGLFPQDLILEADPRLTLELDLAWVVRGGEDPLHWLAKYADRITSVHIKDLAAPGENAEEDGWADVGHGTIDWPAVMEFGVRADSIDDLLAAADIDIIVNLTIPAAHFSVTKSILEAGKHAYSEKPLVLTLEEGEELRALAAAKGLRVGSAPDTFLGGTHQHALFSAWRGANVGHWAVLCDQPDPTAWACDPCWCFDQQSFRNPHHWV